MIFESSDIEGALQEHNSFNQEAGSQSNGRDSSEPSPEFGESDDEDHLDGSRHCGGHTTYPIKCFIAFN